MSIPRTNQFNPLFADLEIQFDEDEQMLSRDDLEDMAKALNESLIKALREAGY